LWIVAREDICANGVIAVHIFQTFKYDYGVL
jgi:hypothetical protein